MNAADPNIALQLLLRLGQFGTGPAFGLQTGLQRVQRTLVADARVLELLLLLADSLLDLGSDLGNFHLNGN
jgi:hypothetical protein